MLYKHQLDLIEKNPAKHGIFLDVGCGKSRVAIELVNKNVSSCLVITTKSLKKNWRNEFTKWNKNTNLLIKIMSKEEFRRDWKLVNPYQAVVVDEAHFFGNYKSQMAKALMHYIKKWEPNYVWLLTATPILSNVTSAWTLGKYVGHNYNFRTFQDRFFYQVKMGRRMIPMQRKGIEQEIAQYLKSFGTVVSKEEALDLPETVHLFEYFEPTPEQKKAIKDLDKDPTSVTPIVYWTKQLQILNGTLKTGDNEYIEIESEKKKRVLELVEQYPKSVIVCRQTAELNMLREAIPNSFIYNGATPEAERDEIIRKVNNGEGTMLINAQMGVGFNLTGVNIVIFYSHTFDFVAYSQMLGRCHRIGQKNKVTYIHMIVEKTIDQEVWKCLERKESFDIALYGRPTTES